MLALARLFDAAPVEFFPCHLLDVLDPSQKILFAGLPKRVATSSPFGFSSLVASAVLIATVWNTPSSRAGHSPAEDLRLPQRAGGGLSARALAC